MEAYGESLAKFAAEKPWFQFMGIWPLDGGDYCECEACRDPLTIYRANVRIAEKMKRVRPDLIVEHLAYTPQSFSRPTHAMPENMSVLVCSTRNRTAYRGPARPRTAVGHSILTIVQGITTVSVQILGLIRIIAGKLSMHWHLMAIVELCRFIFLSQAGGRRVLITGICAGFTMIRQRRWKA